MEHEALWTAYYTYRFRGVNHNRERVTIIRHYNSHYNVVWRREPV